MTFADDALLHTAWGRLLVSFALPLFFVIGLGETVFAQTCQVTDNYTSRSIVAPPPQPLTLVAFGTSLMWGNGLKPQHTLRHEMADWLVAETNRPVHLVTFAHSGALLAAPTTPVGPNPAPAVGDLNSALPTVEEQIDCAAALPELSKVDLILIDGCINDVGAESIAYPWTETQELETRTDASCGAPMFAALQKIGQNFPSAIVVLVGYFPLVSTRSSVFGFSGTRRLASHASKVYEQRHPTLSQAPKPRKSRKEERDIMVVNSEVFYQHSKRAFHDSVSLANSAAGNTHFFYAGLPEISTTSGEVTVDPLYAYGAPHRHLWMISFRFLFWAFYKDEKYWFRQRLCEKYINVLSVDELVCSTNPAFHPNVAGESDYVMSVEAVIPPAALNTWKVN